MILRAFAATTTLGGILNAVSGDPIFLNITIDGDMVGGVPDNQWEQDVKTMESFVRAQWQTTFAKQMTGFEGAGCLTYRPSTEAERSFCQNNKVVKQSGFANISVFGLGFTLTMFGILTALDFGVLRFFLLLEKPSTSRRSRVRQWIQDGVFQLQRAAYEASDKGIVWTRQGKEIPTTQSKMSDLAFYGISYTAKTPNMGQVSTAGKASAATPNSDVDTSHSPRMSSNTSSATLAASSQSLSANSPPSDLQPRNAANVTRDRARVVEPEGTGPPAERPAATPSHG